MDINSILRGIGGAPDDITNLADKVGIDPSMAEKAISALGIAHPQEGDTVELAASQTGLDSGILSRIVSHIGGEGSLAHFSGMIDKDGDGNPINDLTNMAKGLFKKD